MPASMLNAFTRPTGPRDVGRRSVKASKRERSHAIHHWRICISDLRLTHRSESVPQSSILMARVNRQSKIVNRDPLRPSASAAAKWLHSALALLFFAQIPALPAAPGRVTGRDGSSFIGDLRIDPAHG